VLKILHTRTKEFFSIVLQSFSFVSKQISTSHIEKKNQIILICFYPSRKEVSRQNQETPTEDSNSTYWKQYVSNLSLTQNCVVFRKLLPLSASIYPFPTEFSEPVFAICCTVGHLYQEKRRNAQPF